MRASYLFLPLASLLSFAAPAQTEPERLREVFKTAYAQADARRPDEADTEALRGYVLYPYLQAARMRWSLVRIEGLAREASLERRIREFLAAHRDLPVTRELQRDWLRYLGERALWDDFLDQAPAELSDSALRCYRYSARLAAKNLEGLREEMLEHWLDERNASPACKAPFQWLDTPERLGDAEIMQRARFAAREKLPAPAALASLPPEQQAAAAFWRRLLAQPERGLRRFLAGETLLDPGAAAPDAAEVADALLEAFDRVARRDSRQVRALFGALHEHKHFDDGQRGALQRSYALGLAYDHDPDAVTRFDLPATALDPLAHEWRVRAAMLHGFWKQALRWLEAMPPEQQSEPRWIYWRARALEQRGDDKAAKPLYEQAAKEREYYAFLAAERLKQKPDLRPKVLAENGETQKALAELPALHRARELFGSDLADLAAAEFRHAMRELPPESQAQAALLAASWGWHDRSILLLAELTLWDDLWLRFPTPYDAAVETARKGSGVSAEWIYMVLRTESLYNPRAVSRSDALGLMQLLLPTARQVARQAKARRPGREDLFQPDTNLRLGSLYLRELLQRFDGRLILALAGYNAGPQRVPGWLPKTAVPGDVWVENVPYNETRTYIQRALSNLVFIGWRLNGEPTPALPHLADVVAASDDKS